MSLPKSQPALDFGVSVLISVSLMHTTLIMHLARICRWLNNSEACAQRAMLTHNPPLNSSFCFSSQVLSSESWHFYCILSRNGADLYLCHAKTSKKWCDRYQRKWIRNPIAKMPKFFLETEKENYF